MKNVKLKFKGMKEVLIEKGNENPQWLQDLENSLEKDYKLLIEDGKELKYCSKKTKNKLEILYYCRLRFSVVMTLKLISDLLDQLKNEIKPKYYKLFSTWTSVEEKEQFLICVEIILYSLIQIYSKP